MSKRLSQSDILQQIIEIRIGNEQVLIELRNKTEDYLKAALENHPLPENYSKEKLINDTLLKVSSNINTYNPKVNTYEIWVLNILNNFITGSNAATDIYGNTINTLNENIIEWNMGHKERMPMSNLNPFDTVYMKTIKAHFYRILKQIDPEREKVLLLSFQNPPDQKFWMDKLGLDTNSFGNHFLNAVKDITSHIFESKDNEAFASIVVFLTEKLSCSYYLTQKEVNLINDDKMRLALMYSLSYKYLEEAAGEMPMAEEEYKELLFSAIFELSKVFKTYKKSDHKEQTDVKEQKELDYEEIDLDAKIHDYYKTLLIYGSKLISTQIPYAMEKDFRDYRNTIDFIYLVFTEQFNPSLPTIQELLEFAATSNASDLHLSAGLPPVLRIDGDMTRVVLPALYDEVVRNLINDTMNENQKIHYKKYLETDFSMELPGIARFRVNAYNQNRGAGAAFRTIPQKVITLEELNAPELFKSIVDVPNGLILIAGPTGSGKSTTLAALIDYKNKKEFSHIITIEDPIEFVYQSEKCLINQREVHKDTLGFNEALRSALREDPDIILVGELRDLETIRLALTAAETGHLVLATLHTNSAPKTVDRIIDVFPANEKIMMRFMLAESLRAVITQTLIKKIGGGRCAVWEILLATTAVRSLIREDKIHQIKTAMTLGQADGMQTLDQHLKLLLKDGIINPFDARAKAQDKSQFLTQ